MITLNHCKGTAFLKTATTIQAKSYAKSYANP